MQVLVTSVQCGYFNKRQPSHPTQCILPHIHSFQGTDSLAIFSCSLQAGVGNLCFEGKISTPTQEFVTEFQRCNP